MKYILILFLSWATTAFAVPTRIMNLAVSGYVTASSVNLTCLVPSATTLVTSIELRISPVSITAPNYGTRTIAGTVSSPGPQGTLVTFPVTGLNPNTLYYFVVKAKDTAWSAISNGVSVTTKGVTKATKISWTLKEDGGVMPTSFFILWGNTPEMSQEVILPAGTSQYTFTGLSWGTTYRFQVYSCAPGPNGVIYSVASSNLHIDSR